MPAPTTVTADGVAGRAHVMGPDHLRVEDTTVLCRTLGLARHVTSATDAPTSGPVDLLVALGSPAPAVLDAIGSLETGGVLVWEGEGSPARVRGLRAAGFETATYWRRRHEGLDTLFVPLDVVGAARWYVDELADVRGPAGVLARRLGSGSARLTHALLSRGGRSWTCVAVRGGRQASPAVLTAAGRSTRELPVVLTRGEGEWSRVVLLPFGAGDRSPRRVVKLPRLVRHAGATEDEHRLLTDLAASLPADLADSAPAPLGLGRWNDLPVATESYVPGRPLGLRTRTSRDAGETELRRAARWLADLATVRPPLASDVPSLDRTLAAAAGACTLDLTAGALARFGDAALAGAEPPPTFEHGDLTPTNLRLAGGRLTAVDWEAGRVGRPLVDLLYLLLHWPWPEASGSLERSFVHTYLSTDGTPARTARAVVTGHLQDLRLPSDVVAPLLAHVLARQALDREARRSASANPPPGNVYAELLARLLRTPGGSTWW